MLHLKYFLQIIGQKEVCGTLVPELDLKSLEIILPTNGAISLPYPSLNPGENIGDDCSQSSRNRLENIKEDLSALLELELNWVKFQQKNRVNKSLDLLIPGSEYFMNDLSEQWAELLSTMDPKFLISDPTNSLSTSLKESCQIHPFHILTDYPSKPLKKNNKDELIQIPIGESVVLSALFRNRLSTKVSITNLSLEIFPNDSFSAPPTFAVSITPGGSVNVLVEASPTELGIYRVRILHVRILQSYNPI